MSEVSAIVERIGAEGIRTVDFRFIDLAGRWLLHLAARSPRPIPRILQTVYWDTSS